MTDRLPIKSIFILAMFGCMLAALPSARGADVMTLIHVAGAPIEPALAGESLASSSTQTVAMLAGQCNPMAVVRTGGVSSFGFPGATLAAAQAALNTEEAALQSAILAVMGENDAQFAHHPDFWKAQFGGANYSRDLNSVKFIALNSAIPGSGRPGFTRDTLQFFHGQLQTTPKDAPLIVAFHHALDDPRWASPDDWRRVISALRDRPGTLVLVGAHAGKMNDNLAGVPVVYAPANAAHANLAQWSADEKRWRVSRVDSDGATVEMDVMDEADQSRNTAAREPEFTLHAADKISTPVIRWQKPIAGGGVLAAPLAWGDALYAGATDGTLTALDLAKGRPRWSFDAGGEILGAPAAAQPIGALAKDALILFGVGNGRIFALRPDGSLRWIFYAGWPVFGGPAISPDGHAAYFGTNGGEVLALDTSNGRLIWSNSDPGYAVTSAPAIDGERLYVTAWDGFIYALDRRTGTTLWKRPGPSHFRRPDRTQAPAISTPVVMPGGDFFVADRGWRAGRYSPAGAWRGAMNSGVSAMALNAAGDALYLRRTVSPFCKVSVSGRPIWETRLDAGNTPAPPIEHAGGVYATTDRGALWAFDAATGRALWEYRPRPALPFIAPPVAVRVLSAAAVESISPSGEAIASNAGSPERDASAPAAAPVSLLILANTDGTITAIELPR